MSFSMDSDAKITSTLLFYASLQIIVSAPTIMQQLPNFFYFVVRRSKYCMKLSLSMQY